MSPEESLVTRDETARILREYWIREGSIIGVLRLLVAELGPADDPGQTAFGVVVCMEAAFDMPLRDAKRITRWHAIGGDLSDAEIEQRIGTLIPRE
jgi:hypothetical protein